LRFLSVCWGNSSSETITQNQDNPSNSSQDVALVRDYFVGQEDQELEEHQMKTSVRVIKHNAVEPERDLKPLATKSVETSTREIVSTVKSWIEEIQLRKRTQIHSFTVLTVAASARK
jgi:hypothetical protein